MKLIALLLTGVFVTAWAGTSKQQKYYFIKRIYFTAETYFNVNYVLILSSHQKCFIMFFFILLKMVKTKCGL